MKETLNYHGRDLEAMYYAQNYSEWILHEFQQYINGVVADIGCGSGGMIRLLLQCTPEKLIALEPSLNMFAVLQHEFENIEKLELVNDELNNVHNNYKEKLDTIMYINVLEHIEDDNREISLAHSCLKKGGYICIFVPALQLLYSDFDKEVGHHRRYNTGQLKSLLSHNGFSIEKVKYFDIAGILPWLVTFRLLKKTLVGGQVKIYDNLIIPIVRKFEHFIKVPIGKNALIIGKKI